MSLLSNRSHEDRPWGSFDRFTLDEASSVKILNLNPGMRFSLQKHAHRSEFWRVVAGSGTVRINDEERPVTVGDEIEVPQGALHRLTGGEAGLTVLEITFGHFDENDIERIEDDFNRT